jgi:predicted transcriptional regulator
VTRKDEVIEIIRRLPDDATLQEIISALQLHLKVAQGLREIEAGRGVPHEQVRAKLQKWLA